MVKVQVRRHHRAHVLAAAPRLVQGHADVAVAHARVAQGLPVGLEIDPRQASYFLGRRVIRMSARSSLPFWQQRLFIMMANHSARAIEFFRIPPDRVVELGMQMSV